jgi:hypothetical protein
LLEVSYDDSGTFKSRKIAASKLRPYKVYCANLTQTSTNAPTADVFENTLSGTPTFSYDGVGVYKITLTGEWTADKVFILICNFGYNVVSSSRVDSNIIKVETYDNAGIASNGVLYDTSIEIRVYP